MSVGAIEDIYPLTSIQEGILFHSLFDPESRVYFEQKLFTLRGKLNLASFRRAWSEAVDRHSIFRTAFLWEELDDPVQTVYRQVSLPFEQLDWRGLSGSEQQDRLREYLENDRRRGFAFTEAPLMRLAVIRVDEDLYNCVWSNHHLLLDGWSRFLLLKEVCASYSAICRGQNLAIERPRPYRDYVGWLKQQNLSEAEAYWRRLLTGFTAPTRLVVDKLSFDSHTPISRYAELNLQLSDRETRNLQFLAHQYRLTLNTIMHGAWALLLGRYSGEDDVLFGGVSSGRSADLPGIDSMIGLFINTLPLRAQIPPGTSLMEWLKQLQLKQVEMLQHEHSPLVKIKGWSEVPPNRPLFETILVFENYPTDFSFEEMQAVGIDLDFSQTSYFEQTGYPLTLIIKPGRRTWLEICYDANRLDEATVRLLLEHYRALLTEIAENPMRLLSELSMMAESERHQVLVEWNDTAVEYSPDESICQMFREQAALSPDAIAVVFNDQQISYGELNRRANQLARYLRKLGAGPEASVGILLERSVDLVVSLLGALNAGSCYIPLDPTYPRERLTYILEDAQVSLLLTERRLHKEIPVRTEQTVCLDTDWETIVSEHEEPLSGVVMGETLAYIIYTSGSTGKPKGVQVTFRALANCLNFARDRFGLTPHDRWLSVTTVSFDIAALEIYLPLIIGARLTIASREVTADGIALSESLRDSGATALQATPATWRLLLERQWPGNRQLSMFCGGEELSADLAGRLLEKGARLWNLYGPTETTIWSTARRIRQSEAPVLIGYPFSNTEVYLLNDQLRPLPAGLLGALYIGGAGLARGYLNKTDLTAERFIPDHFSKRPGSRLYRTGDLARYKSDGNLDYFGRSDHQVKIRGHRVELAEVEAALRDQAMIKQAVVLASRDASGENGLIAYLVPAQNVAINIGELRESLKHLLPHYMTPNAFITLEALPLTHNGKIDRLSLPKPSMARVGPEDVFVAPRTPMEERLAKICAQTLGLERIGVHHNFLDLGGHSLLAVRLMSRVHEAFQVELPLRVFFEQPTVAGLSLAIVQRQAAEADRDELAQILAEVEGLSEEEAHFGVTSQNEKRTG